MREKNEDEPVSFIQESLKGDLVAAAKRNADGQALSNQRRDHAMDIDALMNKSSIVRPPMVVSEPKKSKTKAKKTKEASGDPRTEYGSTIKLRNWLQPRRE